MLGKVRNIMKYYWLFLMLSIVSVGLLLSHFPAIAADSNGVNEPKSILIVRTREQDAKKIIEQRSNIICDLIAKVKSDPAPVQIEDDKFSEFFHSEKHMAITLLGALRASEAVDVLVENLLYRTGPRLADSSPISWEERHPAGLALIRIGNPAISPVVDKLCFTDSTNTVSLCTWILTQILSKELAKAQINLTKDTVERTISGNVELNELTDPFFRKLHSCKKEQLIEIKKRLEDAEKSRYFDKGYITDVLQKRNINEEIISVYSSPGVKGEFKNGKLKIK